MSEQLIKTPGVFGENGNFLLERELGSGGMGGVYMGRDKMLDRPVAVKVMLKELGDDAEFVEKFKKEAQSAARLIHPNIAQIYSYGICDGLPYIAMELAAGGSLYSIMNANPGKTDVARVIKICQQVAQALQCASDQGCVHGDVKPENILLDANGNAKLVDFGLAAMQKDTSEIWGTPYYISPEKVKKEEIDFRSDMYSLGGTLYHALTGVAPFEGEDSIAVVKKRFEGAPKKPSEIRSELTPAIDKLVMTMLAQDKADRYPSFEALIEAFKSVLTSGLTHQAAAEAKAEKKPSGRRMTTVHGRRTTSIRRATAVSLKKKAEESGDEGALDETERPESEEDEEEEAGSHLGLKVAGVILGVILLIGGVLGGLVWYQIANKKAREADEQAQIVAGIDKAKTAIHDTVVSANKFADEFDQFAGRAISECQKATDDLAKIVPPEEVATLKPGPSKELLDAIAATNEVVQVDSTNAVEAVQAATEEAPKADEEKSETKLSDAAVKMVELWNRAYGCQACAVRIRHSVRKLALKGAEADECKTQTQEDLDRLAELSRTVVEMLDAIKTSKDVGKVRSDITLIKSSSERHVAQTKERLRTEARELERKKKAKEDAEAEQKRQQELADARAAKIGEEMSAISNKFDTVLSQGYIRLLDWKNAKRQLESLKGDLTTSEAQIALEGQLRKIANMKKVQDIFIKCLPNYTFKRGSKLKNCKIDSISEKEIVVIKADGSARTRLTWPKFYREYPGNLNEIINGYIVSARLPTAVNKLSLREWADAMSGAALTMQLICAEVNENAASSAIERSETLVKTVVKQFPEYAKTAKEFFPNLKIETESED